jgi:hypothetical protein
VSYIARLNNGCALCFPRGLHQNVFSVCPDDEATRFDSITDATRRAITSGLRQGQFTIEEAPANHAQHAH